MSSGVIHPIGKRINSLTGIVIDYDFYVLCGLDIKRDGCRRVKRIWMGGTSRNVWFFLNISYIDRYFPNIV
jgi:hypothetical protein